MSAPVQNNPPTQKRSRIVISLDRAREMMHLHPHGQPGGAKRRKLPVALIVLGSLALLLIVGGIIFWQVYKTRPAYSLALLVDAAQRNDGAAFDRVVDTGKVIESFAPQVIDQATGRLGTALTPEMRQRVEALVPVLLPNVVGDVRGEVMRHVRELTTRAEGKPFFLLALYLPYIVDIKQQGDTAIATAKDGDRNLELTMQRTPEKRWKVVAVKDDALAKRIVDDISKDLPAIGTDLGKEIEKRLPGILPGGQRGGRRRGR